MIDERYVTLIEQMGMIPGSSWKAKDGSYVLVVLNEIDEDNQEARQWCRVLKISAEDETVVHDTMFWPYLVGLAKAERIFAVK